MEAVIAIALLGVPPLMAKVNVVALMATMVKAVVLVPTNAGTDAVPVASVMVARGGFRGRRAQLGIRETRPGPDFVNYTSISSMSVKAHYQPLEAG